MTKLKFTAITIALCLFACLATYPASAGDGTSNIIYKNKRLSALAYAPDGKTIACGLRGSAYPPDNDPAVIDLRDAKTGRLLRSLKAGFGELKSMTISPNGRWVAATVGTGGWRRFPGDPPYPKVLGEAYLWDIKSGRLKSKLTIAGGQALCLAFSPNSQYAALGSGDTRIRLWNLATGKTKWAVGGQGQHVSAIDFSPDGKTIVTASWDKSLRLWNTSSGKLKRGITKGIQSSLVAAAFSPKGVIASVGNDRLRLWNSQGKLLRNLGETRYYTALEFSPDGSKMAAKDPWGGVTVWSFQTYKVIKTITTKTECAVAFTPDGKYLAASNTGNEQDGPYESTVELHKL